jgi:hypothetical protein
MSLFRSIIRDDLRGVKRSLKGEKIRNINKIMKIPDGRTFTLLDLAMNSDAPKKDIIEYIRSKGAKTMKEMQSAYSGLTIPKHPSFKKTRNVSRGIRSISSVTGGSLIFTRRQTRRKR